MPYSQEDSTLTRMVYVNEPEPRTYIASDIEEEEEDEMVATQPFNPKDISISVKKVSMDTIVRRIEQKKINFSPDFQRTEVWDAQRKSRLIESLMLNIPIPMFYISADESDVWTVVDGLQRLSTIRDFVVGKRYLESKEKNRELKGEGFELCDLEFWPQYNGYTLNQLPSHLYNRIMETEFNFTIVDPGTPEDVKRNIFKRINTGGMLLSQQEIRHALYPGKAANLLKDLAQTKEFIEVTQNSIKSQRMEDRELILRFVAFLVRDYAAYRTQPIDDWLADTMLIINSAPKYSGHDIQRLIKFGRLNLQDIQLTDTKLIADLFLMAMNRANKLFGRHAFRRSYGNEGRKPINKSLFETWGNVLAKLTSEQYDNLLNHKEQMLDDYYQMLSQNDFVNSISRDSMKKASVMFRFGEINKLVNKFSV